MPKLAVAPHRRVLRVNPGILAIISLMMLVSVGTVTAEEANIVKKAGASVLVVANLTAMALTPSAGALRTTTKECVVPHHTQDDSFGSNSLNQLEPNGPMKWARLGSFFALDITLHNRNREGFNVFFTEHVFTGQCILHTFRNLFRN
jgi:hypothetical protein